MTTPLSSSSSSILARRWQAPKTSVEKYHFMYFRKAMENSWSHSNEKGILTLAIAENGLTFDLFHERMKKCQDYPLGAYSYGSFTGLPSLIAAFIKLLNSTFLKGVELNPKNLLIMNGATAILEALSFCILDVNDGVLIPAPYYFNYDADIESRAQGKPVAVYLDYENDIKQQLTQAKEKSEKQGVTIRALIVTNPDNPTGSLIPEEVLTAQAQWCAENQIHLISNELYSNSIFNPCGKECKSLFKIGRNMEGLKDRLHLIYGLSKDFGVAGLRIGMIYTDSETIVKALYAAAAATSPPVPLQHQLTEMLNDLEFVNHFFEDNKRRLLNSYTILTNGLKEAGIPFQEANGGLFVWIDLREFLDGSDFASERRLFEKLFDHGLFLTPGEVMSAREPGFFRICYANVEIDALTIVHKRLTQCRKN